MTQEGSESGTIGFSYYLYYLSQAGVALSIITFVFFGLSVSFKIAADWWLGIWSAKTYEKLSDDDYIWVFYILGITSAVFLILRAIALGLVTQLASVNIFKLIVWNILRRPMSFFDTTPSGVIINRCTNDVD
jgi:ABC-type multidrug transport system fused ATPase/permease subunit